MKMLGPDAGEAVERQVELVVLIVLVWSLRIGSGSYTSDGPNPEPGPLVQRIDWEGRTEAS